MQTVANPPNGAVHILNRNRVKRRDVLFPLTHTGGFARVRRLPLIKLITLSSPSPTLQSVVLEVFGNVQDDPDTATPVSGGLLEQIGKNDALINGVCILGFRDPRLTETEEEANAANDPHVLWVEEIDQRDRQAYYDLVNDSESEAAKALAPFPQNGLESPAGDEGLPPAAPPVAGDAAA